MSAQPVASVLISATEREDQLTPLLASVASQTQQSWELIIAARHTDRAAQACTQAGIAADKFRVIRTLEGIPTGRNQLLQHALGRFITFPGIEDVLAPEKLAQQITMLEAEPQVGAVFTHVTYVDATGKPNPALSNPFNEDYSEEDLAHRLLQGNVIAFSTGMIRKTSIEKLGEFNDALPLAQDFDFILRGLLESTTKVIPQALVTTQVSDGELSGNMRKRVAHENWQVICRHAGGIMRRWPLLPHTTFAFLSHVADLATVAEDWQVVVDYLNIKRQCFGHDDKDCLRILDCLIKQGRLSQAESLLRTMKSEQGEFEPQTLATLDGYFERLGIAP
jgi:glycosyltransferase involved in cell wall biosynthesis